MIPVETTDDFAEALALVRALTGLTQTAVGIEIGTGAQRVGDYERGRRVPNVRTALKILAVYGYRLDIVPISAVDVSQSSVQESDHQQSRDEK